MTGTLTIRLANTADLQSIKKIIDVSFPRFFRYFANHSVHNFNEPTLVGEEGNVIVGFTKLIQFEVAKEKYGCILWIAVHPNHRHEGIAFKLTMTGLDRLKTQGSLAVFASTQRNNKGALKTLRKAGFRRLGFLALYRMFGWRFFDFSRGIWLAPGEVVEMHG